MSRIEERFSDLKAQGKRALIPFIMGGDPDYETSLALLKKLPEAGASLIEIGIPFADPMADGPVIQEAGERALSAGMTLTKILSMVSEFRRDNKNCPIILMGYANPLYTYGLEKFCQDAAQFGVDGLIVVDLPPEEDSELQAFADLSGLDVIRLVTPTSGDSRTDIILARARGFIYYVAVAGVTGTKSAAISDLEGHFERLRQKTTLPLAVGFGIKTPAQVKEMSAIADAIVVGSAIVNKIATSKKADIVDEVCNQVRGLSAAL